MADVTKKIYIGSWKESIVNQWLVVCTINLDQIPKEAIKRSRNGNDYVTFVLGTRNSPWLHGETHGLYIKV